MESLQREYAEVAQLEGKGGLTNFPRLLCHNPAGAEEHRGSSESADDFVANTVGKSEPHDDFPRDGARCATSRENLV